MDRKKKIWIGIILVMIILVSGLGFMKYRTSNYSNKLQPNIYIEGIDVGGKTKEAARETVQNRLNEIMNEKRIVVNVGVEKLDVQVKDLEVTVDIDSAVNEAYEYGKDSNFIVGYFDLLSKKEFSVKTNFNAEKLDGFIKLVSQKTSREPVNASITFKDGKRSIKKEEAGEYIDENRLREMLKDTLSYKGGKTDTIINVDTMVKVARIKEADLEGIDTKLASYSTDFGTSADGRVTNIKLATSAIDGLILLPEDEFSFNNIVGDTTPDKGYMLAGTYVGKKVVEGYGGGICQVSSTLYNAVMQAHIMSTERRNHNMTVGYVPAGCDATIAYGFIDYKFKNTFNNPIYINAYTIGSVLQFDIYGGKENKENGITYSLRGERAGGTDSKTFRVNSYLDKYKNGVYSSSEFIATDVYNAHE